MALEKKTTSRYVVKYSNYIKSSLDLKKNPTCLRTSHRSLVLPVSSLKKRKFLTTGSLPQLAGAPSHPGEDYNHCCHSNLIRALADRGISNPEILGNCAMTSQPTLSPTYPTPQEIRVEFSAEN